MPRKYSDREKAEALAQLKSNGGNVFRTAQELKIPWSTLAGWSKGDHGINPGVTELREEKEQELTAILESVARKYLQQAGDPYVVAATPGNLAMTATGIAIDKMQLLKGAPTSITAEAERDPVLQMLALLNDARKLNNLPLVDRAYAEQALEASIQRAKLKLA